MEALDAEIPNLGQAGESLGSDWGMGNGEYCNVKKELYVLVCPSKHGTPRPGNSLCVFVFLPSTHPPSSYQTNQFLPCGFDSTEFYHSEGYSVSTFLSSFST